MVAIGVAAAFGPMGAQCGLHAITVVLGLSRAADEHLDAFADVQLSRSR